MRKYIKEQLGLMEQSKNKGDFLPIIQFIQHERLIHLIITIITAVLFFLFGFIFILEQNIITSILFITMTIVLTFYIEYYCFMENSIQKMYYLYSNK